jgi:di/tricarboxylate transporter
VTLPIAALIAITILTVVFLAFEWVPADVVAIALLLLLVLTGLLPSDKAFAGFGSDTFIILFGLLVLTAALLRTGVVDLAGRTILRYTGNNPIHLVIVVMISTSALSAVMSNTAATAFFVPIVLGIARRAKMSPAKLLMPLAFSSILTSSVSLISTSTNVVVSGVMTQYGMPPMGMFELAPVGIPIAVVGLLYMLTVGRKMIPDRFASDDPSETPMAVRPYLSELVILPTSSLVGKTLAASGLGRDLDVTVVRIVREKTQYLDPRSNTVLRADDVVIVEGQSEEILKIKDIAGIEIKADVKLTDPSVTAGDLEFVEVILMPGSPLVGRTLKGFGFRDKYDLQVLGMSRHGESVHRKISTIPLRVGDILLIQGRHEKIAELQSERAFRVIGSIQEPRLKKTHAPIAIGIFLAVLALATFKFDFFPITLPVAVMLGVLAVFVTRCVSPEEAYCEVEWRALFLVACMLALGVAMEHTGTAAYLAAQIVELAGDAGSFWLLTGFFALTVLLTQPMSNQAAAIVVLPVALQTAFQLSLNPRTFAMMTAVAASCSYLTPLEPSCLMVYGPGRYKFMDFLKVGALLTFLIYALAIVLVPRFWPLR